MNYRIVQSVVTGAVVLAVLAGCEDGRLAAPGAGPESSAQVSTGPREITEVREVERPDVFSVTELALWSGRPTFGAVWVSHPDVRDPERVKITNSTNGQTVSGALYRREAFNPGPRIEVSADAAAALGMLAGQPIELSIVAVRQEEVVVAVIPAPAEAPAAEEAAIEAEPEAVAEDGGGADLAVAGAAGAAVAAEGERKVGFWERFSSNFKKKPDEGRVATAEASVSSDASAPVVETAPLDPVAVTAAAAIAEAEAEAEKADDRPSTAPSAAAAGRSYVQAGLFSVRANADAAAASLRQGGILPIVEQGSGANGPFWRVLVGPLGSADEQKDVLAQVQALGYGDAYLITN